MTTLVLYLLAVMWAVVLVPPWLRNRQHQGRARNSVHSFRTQLDSLGRTSPGSYRPGRVAGAPHGATIEPAMALSPSAGLPRSAAEAERRRRDIMRLLAAAAGITLLFWLMLSSVLVLALHLVIDVLGLAYVGLVMRHRRSQAERELKVRQLRPAVSRVTVTEPALMERSGS